ncbi:hypothetical protein C8J57DRAFT_1178102 [Mycena rebaudengoi]|nr:hypothetical protein C8J57DRAFT_1178102 [Mycena rebaudengoi]
MWTIAPAEATLTTSTGTSTSTASPALPTASTTASPALGTGTSAAATAPSKRRTPTSSATGTRKNLTPQSLIPLEAPTQKRNYVMPSRTSRKVVPAKAGGKRTHSAAFEAEEDEEEELGELSPTATLAETIEYKRRQNTIAARKSRKRKLEHQRALEGEVHTLRRQVEVWRERAGVLGGMLRARGVALGEWEEIAGDDESNNE